MAKSVCVDAAGRPQFYQLMMSRRAKAVFYAFDLLWLEGEDRRGLPLVERKQRLRLAIPRESSCLLRLDGVPQGRALFTLV